jgi:uncharacterized protein YndB with AHSA1/START domain
VIDIISEIEAIQRRVGTGQLAAGEGKQVRLSRTFHAEIDDVWDALTNPERINRWFLPISGDFRLGGSYQFEGNAGGRIVACERPNRLLVTWGMGDPSDPASASDLELRLLPASPDSTTLELVHTAIVPAEMWEMYGPGAVGVGWDGGMLGLGLHLAGGHLDDKEAWQVSDEAREFYRLSSRAWGEASRAAGTDEATVAANVANTTAFYAPPPEAA